MRATMRLASVAVVGMALLAGERAAGKEPALKTEQEKRSYALGVSTAQSIRRQGVEVDPALAARGLRDALKGKPLLLSDEEVTAILTGIQADLRQKQIRPKPQAEEAKAKEEAFLAENAKKEGVVTTPSGLQYKVLQAGDGQKPTSDDRVLVNYRGTFLDGTEFDSSYKRGQPAAFDMVRVIPGWKEALKLMPAGSKWQLFIPANLAYGERGVRGKKRAPVTIPPNATLIFETELLSVMPGRGAPATTTTEANPVEPAKAGGG